MAIWKSSLNAYRNWKVFFKRICDQEFLWLQISDEAHCLFTGMQSVQGRSFPHLQNKSVLRNKHAYSNMVTTKLHFEAKDSGFHCSPHFHYLSSPVCFRGG